MKMARPPWIQDAAMVPSTLVQLAVAAFQVPSPPVMVPLPAVPAPFHHWVETPSTMAIRLTWPATEVWITLPDSAAGTPSSVSPSPSRVRVPA